MIIAIDGYEANVQHRVGIGRYAFEILAHLYPLVEKKHTVRVYIPGNPLSDLPKEHPHWQYRVVGPKKLWTFIGLPFALTKDYPKPAVVFSPTHYIPRFVHYPA